MESYYWVNGKAFLKPFALYGYTWAGMCTYPVGSGQSVIERSLDDNYAIVIFADHKKKEISCYPLEIYAPGSPTADPEKYQHMVDKCGDIDVLEKDLIAMHGRQGAAL